MNFSTESLMSLKTTANSSKNTWPALFTRWILALLMFVGIGANAQVISNYTGANYTATTGTYTAITGSTVLLGNSASTNDDGVATAVALPFDFYMNGVRYSYFAACVNGWIRLGTTSAVSSSSPTSLSSTFTNSLNSTSNTQLIAPMWDDLYLLGNTSDKVHYVVTGTAPNRVLTVEWFNAKRNGSGGTSQNFQVKLFETTGVISFVYGTCGVPASSPSASIGFTDNTGGSAHFVSLSAFTTSATASTTTASDAIATTATTGLTFTFTPPITSAPTNITFSNIGQTTLTVNWTNNGSNRVATAVYNSTDNITFNYLGQVTAASTGANITGLTPGTLYYFRLYSVSEGYTGAPLTGSQATNALVPLTGTKTIDNTIATGGNNYISFTDAVNALNINGVGTGGVTFNVTAGQTFTETVPTVSFTGTVANPIVFQKNGAAANPVIVSTGSTGTEAAILINGSDYLTFDGINITASGTALEYGYYMQNATATNGAQNNTIKNCTVTMNRGNIASIAIYQYAAGTAPTSAAGANSNNKYYNLTVKNVSTGIFLNGNSSFPDLNTEIGTTSCAIRNTIGDPATVDDILYAGAAAGNGYGIRATNQGSVKIFNNDISNVTTSINNSTVDGIFIDNLAATVSLGTSDVYNNKITAITNTNTAANNNNVVRGIRINGNTVSGTITRVYNNFISNLQSANTSTTLTTRRIVGIAAQPGGTGAGSAIYVEFNSVRIAASNLTGSNACFEIGVASGPAFRVRNNIFANLTAAQTGGAKHYTWVSTSATSVGNTGSVSNYNDLYVTGTNGFIGLGNATDYATLANWQAGVSQDANSVSSDPQFTSATDLHSSATLLNGAADPAYATNTPYVTIDIDCTTRPSATDIGADEFTVSGCTSATGGTASGTTSFCGSGTPTITATGYTTGLNTTYQWEYSNDNFVADIHDFVGQTTPNALTTGVVTTTTYYRLRVTCTTVPVTGYSNTITVTINTLPTVAVTPTTANFCSPGGTAVTLTASGASTYAWTPTAGLTPTTGAVVSASPAATTTYTVTGTAANGCTNTATATVTVSPAVTISSVTATPSTICSGDNSQLQANATLAAQPGGYAFTANSGAFTPITGGTTVAINADDAVSGLLPLGFTFKYGGVNYTQVVANSNGWLSFNTAATGISAANSRTNSLTAPPAVLLPLLAPLWDDLDGAAVGAASYTTTGTAGARVFTFQWLNWEWDYSANAAVISFQVKLYEADGRVQFVYRSDATPYATGGGVGGASIGLTGATSGNYLSLSGTGAAPTASNSTETSTLAAKPATGQTYSFAPPVPASFLWTPSTFLSSTTIANPVATAVTATTTYTVTATQGNCSATGNVTVTVAAGAAIITDPAAQAKCAGQTATFTVVATGPSLTYQWRKNGVDIPVGTNASAVTATLTLTNVTAADAATYDVVVSSTCGSPITSAGAALTVTTPIASIAVSPSATICSGTSVTLTENGGNATSWSWAPGGQTTQSITVSPSVTTTYTVTATLNGCSATASQIITVNPTPSAVTITPAAPVICTGGSVALTVTGGSANSVSTLGTGTSTTTAASASAPLGPDPLQSYYGGSKQQMIILASELTGLGLTTGSVINSVAFNLATAETARVLASLQVKVSNTALSAFASTTFAAAGTVVRPAANYTVTTGFNTIPFTTGFTWNGTSNIIIEVNFSNNDGGGSGTTTAVYSTTAFASTLFYRVDSNTPAVVDAATTASFAAYTQRNNMQIGFSNQGTITWSPTTGLTPTTGPSVTAAPASTTTYTATSTANGCSSSGTVTVTVNPNYTITASAGSNGSISPNGVTTLTCNGTASQTYTITPDAGYHIADVLVDGVSNAAAIAAGTYTFTNVTANHTISASFAINTYTITASAGANGSIAPNSITTVNSGANQTYTITPDAGYHIADVLVDGVSNAAAIAAGTYTFTNVTANHTISASFAINTYTITASAGANGSIAPNGITTVNSGANQTYTITPDAGYHIADVLVDGVSNAAAIAAGTYTFTNVTANHTISASFAINTYTITASAGANGSIAPNGVTTVNSGANQTYTITPDAGYSIADVLVDGVSNAAAIAAGTYTFTNVTANHTISASFAINTYTITASAGANGSIAPNGITTVNSGANQTYTITPDAGYSIADVLVDGVSNAAAIASGSYTFTNVTANHTISASFAINTYTITASAGANGSIAPNGVTTVNSGANQTYTITPDAGYSIADVLVDGVSNAAAIAAGTYTFTNVTANHTISASFAINTYTITASAGANGSIAPNGVTTVNSGANQTYTITPDAGYSIADVLVDGVSNAAAIAAGTYTFTNVTANHTISASFTINGYTITASAGANGSISPNGITNVNSGGSQTYTITPNACYSIANVLVDGVSNAAAIASGTYTFTNVTANHTISATFVLNTYTITVTDGANGTITPGTGTVNCGANATYTITPDACYAIATLTVDGASVTPAGTYTFTNVTANHTITATYSLTTYTINASAGAGGTITPAGASTVNCGDDATYTITPNTCFSILNVVVDGISQGPIATYTFNTVGGNHTISATFSLNTYTITATSGANGTVTPAGASTINCGDNATYTITPAACYAIADVLVDGVSNAAAIASGTYTFNNVTANHTISATFVQTTYTITATSGANGSVTPAGASTINCGDNATYTITAAACYAIADVLVDGVSNAAAIASGTYTFNNVTANHTISATFVQTTYTITATSGANGTVTPAGASTVNCGDNATYTITPAACYAIADVLVDGVSNAAAIASGTYTFNNVTANHTISATFVQTTYTITATSGANGTVTPGGASTVNCGDNATYTITPAACYTIADVLVDGVSNAAAIASGTYTFNNVTANHTISATFVQTTYTITATSGANGTLTPAGASTINCGDNATYTITPAACYAIADVLVDGVSNAAAIASGTYTFNNVTANHTISATFVQTTYTITATSGANGTVTPAGATAVNCGDDATYIITAAACYSIADVLVDGVSNAAAIASGTYTFTNVTANHTISATFVQTTYTITATSGANGTVTPAGASTVNCGDNATYTITPAACYAIADVLVDGVSNAAAIASGTYTFNNVTANHTISATFVQTTYTITATSGANGSVTPAGASTINCGDNATYTITPAACYAIADVLVDGVSNAAAIASGTYTFNNVTANHTISATFVQLTYTITATSGANGTVTPAGASTINCGDNATYTITPAACYAIADVLVDGVSNAAAIASGTYTFTNVTANHTISATFVQTTYTITATSGANGTVTPAGVSTVNCGDNATYTITPAACYAIADVLVDGVSNAAAIASGIYTFNNVTANHTISATFVQTTYTITATTGANGTVTPAGASTVNCGDNATYTITPAACYAIGTLVVDGVSVTPAATYTFTNVTANHTISATFVQTTYTITATSGANGTVTPAGTSTVNCGSNATYTITPAACYAIGTLVVDGVSVPPAATYTFTNVTANHTISATFVQTTYTITATSGANGTVTPAGTSTVNCGSNATYTITPAACYAIATLVVDGVSVTPAATYTFTNVTANHTISATFVQLTYTITATSGANGTVTPAGTSTVNCGSNATYTITANGGYAIQNVIVDGVSQGAVGTYTFTNVTANHTISATFVAVGNNYTITASAGTNGSIAPNGVTTVASGGSQSYTITPAACYHVADVLVDGTSAGAVTSYTFTNVTSNHTISATFAINGPAATPVVTGFQNVCPYINNGQVTYTASSQGATGFTWVTPPNVTIVTGQGTANLTVTFQSGFVNQVNKQLRVTATSPCGNSMQVIYYLAAAAPSTPQPITASSSDVCPIIGTAGTITYKIPSVVGATSYLWSNPAGTNISHPNGTGINDTLITLSFTNAFATSALTVRAANDSCGASGLRSLTITRANPSQPGLISGPTNACPYMAPGGTAASYSIAPVTGATSYTWTAPGGAVITGQGTTMISFTYPSSFTSGSVTVTATNGCGTSTIRSLAISKLLPAAPSAIDVIALAPCPDRVYSYTLSAMPANSTSVQWTVPAGGTITSGQGTTSITVSYSTAAINGNITAQALSNCGSSSIRVSTVKLPSCAIERPAYTQMKGGVVEAKTMSVNVYPNPSVSDFNLQVLTAGKEAINVRILDLQGREYRHFTVQPNQTTTLGSDLKAGAYMMEVKQGAEVKTSRLIKF